MWKDLNIDDFFASKVQWSSVKSYQIYYNLSSFYSKNDMKLVKYIFFLVKKWEIRVIISIIVITRSLDRIFNPMRYTHINNTWYYLRTKTTIILKMTRLNQ